MRGSKRRKKKRSKDDEDPVVPGPDPKRTRMEPSLDDVDQLGPKKRRGRPDLKEGNKIQKEEKRTKDKKREKKDKKKKTGAKRGRPKGSKTKNRKVLQRKKPQKKKLTSTTIVKEGDPLIVRQLVVIRPFARCEEEKTKKVWEKTYNRAGEIREIVTSGEEEKEDRDKEMGQGKGDFVMAESSDSSHGTESPIKDPLEESSTSRPLNGHLEDIGWIFESETGDESYVVTVRDNEEQRALDEQLKNIVKDLEIEEFQWEDGTSQG